MPWILNGGGPRGPSALRARRAPYSARPSNHPTIMPLASAVATSAARLTGRL